MYHSEFDTPAAVRHRNLVQLLGAHLQEDAYLVLEPMTRTLAQAQADPDLSSLLIWRER